MKIGFITSSLSSEDGWGRYSKSLVESVAQHAEVAVITHNNAKNETSLSNVYPVLPRCSFHPKVQWKTYKSCMKYFQGCEIIHSLVEPFAPGSAFAAKQLGVYFIMTLHGTYAIPPKKWYSVRRHFLRYALKSAHMSTTGSLYTEQKAREQAVFGECRFIPNGVDSTLFRRLKDIQPKDFLLTTGAVKSRKGQDVVVEALALLQDEFPNVRYKIVGDTSNFEFVQKIMKRSEVLGINDKVEFLGCVSDKKIVELYNQCRIFILAARDIEGQFEGFPMVFYEANACGAPVVTTRGFGSEYAIKDGKNGFLVKSESPEDLANVLKNILSDETLRENMSTFGLREAANHTWDKIAQNYLMKMYRDILKS
ncbi:MAG: glycosyltransferase family 4 protein [Candidatus Peribacteraceae bacterium]|nr:glycosyltransferase family 4 protein [Candidatus Peribacteraceae bacterium]